MYVSKIKKIAIKYKNSKYCFFILSLYFLLSRGYLTRTQNHLITGFPHQVYSAPWNVVHLLPS